MEDGKSIALQAETSFYVGVLLAVARILAEFLKAPLQAAVRGPHLKVPDEEFSPPDDSMTFCVGRSSMVIRLGSLIRIGGDAPAHAS